MSLRVAALCSLLFCYLFGSNHLACSVLCCFTWSYSKWSVLMVLVISSYTSLISSPINKFLSSHFTVGGSICGETKFEDTAWDPPTLTVLLTYCGRGKERKHLSKKTKIRKKMLCKNRISVNFQSNLRSRGRGGGVR